VVQIGCPGNWVSGVFTSLFFGKKTVVLGSSFMGGRGSREIGGRQKNKTYRHEMVCRRSRAEASSKLV
jgi:hypothetical protein